MDPITLILAALAAGAGKGLTDAAATAIADSYSALKSALSRVFAGNRTAETVLQEYVDDPDAHHKALAEQLKVHAVADNQHILELAQRILDHCEQVGPRGAKYVVDARHARNVQTGDHNTQINN